jgi:hypothetical protein
MLHECQLLSVGACPCLVTQGVQALRTASVEAGVAQGLDAHLHGQSHHCLQLDALSAPPDDGPTLCPCI